MNESPSLSSSFSLGGNPGCWACVTFPALSILMVGYGPFRWIAVNWQSTFRWEQKTHGHVPEHLVLRLMVVQYVCHTRITVASIDQASITYALQRSQARLARGRSSSLVFFVGRLLSGGSAARRLRHSGDLGESSCIFSAVLSRCRSEGKDIRV